MNGLYEIIMKHGHPPVKLAGHSWGAWLAFMFAANHPDLIEKLILIGAGIFFLVSAETRIKRRRVLSSLHKLRVFAHIIDMHQLHKDPERVTVRSGKRAHQTSAAD